MVEDDGPFRYLNNHWLFEPVDGGASTAIDFYIDFEFRSRMLQAVTGAVFNEAVRRMVSAFEARAHTVYGAQAEASMNSAPGSA